MEAFMSNQQKVNFKIKFKNATTLIGFFVDDVGNFINKLLQAGADLLSPAQDYDYGYWQGNIKRIWMSVHEQTTI